VSPEQETDGTFLQFLEMKFGIRAIARCLRNYAMKHGIQTLRDMTARWAPSSDHNNPGEYAMVVLQHCEGIATSVTQAIDLTNEQTAFGVIRGIAVAENGHWAGLIADEVVRDGVRLERSA